MKAPAGQLLRVVVRDGEVVPDPSHRLPGRGAYLHPDADCLAAAERRRAFPRALRVTAGVSIEALRVRLRDGTPRPG